MSTKKLNGLDKRATSSRFNIRGLDEQKAGVFAAGAGGTPFQYSRQYVGARPDETGSSSVARRERMADEATQQAERDKQMSEAEAARKRREQEEATRLAEEEARQKLREAQGGGFAANILSGGGLTFGGNARRRLAGS